MFKPVAFLQKLIGSASSIPEATTNKELDVISNPDSSEEEWLQVFHKLGHQSSDADHTRDTNVSISKWRLPFKRFDDLALRAVPLIGLLGIAAYIAVSIEQHCAPRHLDSHWNNMVPLKERLGTSDAKVFRDKILANWMPIKGFRGGYIVFKFDVRSDGSFRNIEVQSPDTTVSQQRRAVDAVLTAGPFFCPTQRTDKFASAKVYFDNGKVSVETFCPRSFSGLDAVDSTDVKFDSSAQAEESPVNNEELSVFERRLR